jgi:flagellar biogenesis protein FliO
MEKKEQAQEERMFRNLLGLVVIVAFFVLALLWLLRQ